MEIKMTDRQYKGIEFGEHTYWYIFKVIHSDTRAHPGRLFLPIHVTDELYNDPNSLDIIDEFAMRRARITYTEYYECNNKKDDNPFTDRRRIH